MSKSVRLYGRLEGAEDIEMVLCLAVLIANGILSPDSDVEDAKYYYTNTTDENCSECQFCNKCLACIINQ